MGLISVLFDAIWFIFVFLREMLMKLAMPIVAQRMNKKHYEALAKYLPEDQRSDPSKWLRDYVKPIFADPKVQHMTVKGESYAIPPPFNPRVLTWAIPNWTPRSNDVIVATWPKTGTTWVREICRQLKNLGKGEDQDTMTKTLFDPIFAYFEGSSEFTRKLQDKLPITGRVWGTHTHSNMNNMDAIKKSGAKVIYVMRNPKDMIISYYKFMHNLPFNKYRSMQQYYQHDLNKFISTLVQGEHPMMVRDGEWYPHHIKTWMQYKDEDFFHYVFYEDIVQDPEKEIRKIAAHINVEASDEEIKRVVDKVSFKEMKKQKEKENALMKTINFFRAGGVGKWKSFLTVDQSELIDKSFNQDMKDLDLDYLNFKYTL